MPAIKSPTLQKDRKPFHEFLATLEANTELTDALQDLVAACTTTGKAGSIALTLKMKPVGGTGQVELDTEVKLKAPTEVRPKSFLFATPQNNLQRENPKQSSLEGMRTADDEADARAVRSIEEATPVQALRAV